MLAEGKEKVDEDIVADALNIRRPAMPKKRKTKTEPVMEKDVSKTGNDTLRSILDGRKSTSVTEPTKVVNG